MKFSIGDLVVDKKDVKPHSSYLVYQVMAFLGDVLLVEFYGDGFGDQINPLEAKYVSKPGSRDWRDGLLRYQESELYSKDESLEERHRLESIRDKLSEEFDLAREQIQTMLNHAAEIIQDAAVIVKAHDKEFMDMKEECKLLYRALDDGGWSHSRMRC